MQSVKVTTGPGFCSSLESCRYLLRKERRKRRDTEGMSVVESVKKEKFRIETTRHG